MLYHYSGVKLADIIRLNNIRIKAKHGYYQAERDLGQLFEVDLELSLDLNRALETDQLEDCAAQVRNLWGDADFLLNGAGGNHPTCRGSGERTYTDIQAGNRKNPRGGGLYKFNHVDGKPE